MPVAACNGIDIYYERSGEGPPLLFLNGSGSTLVTSALVIAPFTKRFDTLAHDQRGLGRSAIPPGPYTMADYARDALALLDHVGWDACRVFGISFGGMVAQELAVTAPERVQRLALICTSAGGEAGASYPLHEREAGPSIMDTRFTAEWLADPDHARDAALVAARTAAPVPTDPEVLRGRREQLLARSHHDVADVGLHRITCPTFVAGGRFDGIAPPANSEAIAQRIPGAELNLYDGGHAFLAQDRRAFPDVLAFLSA